MSTSGALLESSGKEDRMNPQLIEQILNAVRAAIPPDIGRDAERNLRATLEAMLGRLDVVTREEFDVQNAVLARTRSLLEKLEKQIAELEARLGKQ